MISRQIESLSGHNSPRRFESTFSHSDYRHFGNAYGVRGAGFARQPEGGFDRFLQETLGLKRRAANRFLQETLGRRPRAANGFLQETHAHPFPKCR